jgi:catechol 2,3-dioxygenase-like lactoylglutathione lyase family enzyme
MKKALLLPGLLLVVLSGAAFSQAGAQSIARASPQTAGGQPPSSNQSPVLVNTCVITSNIRQIVAFYESVLMLKPKWSGQDYAEFQTGTGVLAIFSAQAQEEYIPGSAEAGKNRSVILQFKVANVDEEYRRLQSIVKTWVKAPSTQPWGTRSIYFRDPDGNLVDFYMRPEAQ